MDRALARPTVGLSRCRDRYPRRRVDSGWSGGRLFYRRRRAQDGRWRAAGDRLFDRLGALCSPPPGDLGSAADAAAHGLAARRRVRAAAVHRRGAGHGAEPALAGFEDKIIATESVIRSTTATTLSCRMWQSWTARS